MAIVISLHESGSLADIDNNRSIAILSTFSKIMEKIVYKKLIAHLKHYDLLFEYQFGFDRNRSTELAVTYFPDLIDQKGGRQ